jgi:hypothetical protein
MINVLTKREYTGQNFDILLASGAEEGDKFGTFKQMLKVKDSNGKTIAGKYLKGAKAFATLMMMREKEDADGKVTKVPYYFKVFSYNEILEVYKNNVVAQSQEIKEAA